VLPSEPPVLPGGALAARASRVGRVYIVPTGPVAALHDVDVDVPSVGLTVITGPSGCGKTTLLSLFIGAETADSGTVEVNGSDVARMSARRRRRLRRRDLGIALARPSDNLVNRLDAAGNLRLAARLRPGRVVVPGALELVGLGGRETARIEELSGGEQQRLSIAIALVGSPHLLILDEPTAELDVRTGRAIVEYLQNEARHRAVLVASHDPSFVEAADALISLADGRRVA
jgi:putative ABC transport system ATP-binding protein